MFKQHFINYQKPSDIYKKLRETKGKINEDQADLIKEILDKIKKKFIKNVLKDKKFIVKIEENKKIINMVEHILYFNQLDQQGSGLKILTADWILSRLQITLAQLKAGHNYDKLKNEVRELLHSLYRSKKLTKQLCKSLIGII